MNLPEMPTNCGDCRYITPNQASFDYKKAYGFEEWLCGLLNRYRVGCVSMHDSVDPKKLYEKCPLKKES